MNQIWKKPGQNALGKKSLHQRPKILVLEDEQGMKTSYFPGLAWNDMGYSLSARQNGLSVQPVNTEQLALSSMATFDEQIRLADSRYADIIRSRKMYSAKSILRDIGRHYESTMENNPISDEFRREGQIFLHSNLLYLISATDSNEAAAGHSQLVARYTLCLTKAMGIDDRAFLAEIERGALLHDIGKIRIPDSILRKAGPLTDKEREIIKEHPLLGYEMVEEFSFLHEAAQVVLFHHESYDGGGYPYGLKGEEIPLEARIFAIADTLDAITSDRPYCKGRSFGSALDEIERVRGTQFDPMIVDAFLSVPEEKWPQIKREMEQSHSTYSIH
jgi:putative nucleotidyltransferase with HDIG domain